jgi:hypothetical protein
MLRQAFPMALMLGMTPEQYWHGEPMLFAAYKEARQLADEKAEWYQWQTGMYVYDAIGRAAPLLNPLSKTHKALPWPEEPYGVTARRDPEERSRKEEKAAHEKMINWILSHKPSK